MPGDELGELPEGEGEKEAAGDDIEDPEAAGLKAAAEEGSA